MPVGYGIVGLNASSSGAAGASVALATGPSSEQIVSELHGQFYETTRAGVTYVLATATAGTTIPVQATNLVSTFTLWNPLASGKNVELIRYTLGVLNATTVVSDVSLYFQSSVGNLVTAPGTLTSLGIRSTNLGSAAVASVCTGYSAATLVNVIGTNAFRAAILGSFGAVTTTNAVPINYDFNGSIIMPPGTLVTVAGNAAQTQAMSQALTFCEWPI